MNKKNKCALKSLEGCLCPEAEQQLQTAKEENEKLRTDKEHYFKESAEFLAQKTILGVANETKLEIIKNLTQQNKQMREALEKIGNLPKDANARISGGKGIDKRLAMARHYISKKAVDLARQALKEIGE